MQMQNLVLSPIDPDRLINEISDKSAEKTLEKVLKAIGVQTNGMNHDHPMDIKQAAEYLGVTVPTMYSKVAKCELPHSKRGNKLYFFKSELQNYIKEGRVSTSQEIEAKAQSYLSKNKKG